MSQCQIVSWDILLEFIEVAFNGILFNREVYPKEIFVRKKIYGIAVNISQHPEINQYIKRVLETVRELIIHDEKCVKNINLILHNNEKLIIEKYIFHLFEFKTDVKESDPYFLKTEEALRTVCLKLSMTNGYLKPLLDNCTGFTIEIDTHEAAHVAISENPKIEDFPWIIKEHSNELNDNKSKLLPLTTINTEYLGLQLYVITSDNNILKNI